MSNLLIHHLILNQAFLPSPRLMKRKKKQKTSQDSSITSVASKKTACDCVNFLMESKSKMVAGNPME
nr:hypothetical protein CFP56_12771 [Quercus suber]